MNSLTDVIPKASTVSGGSILNRLFVVGYVIAIAVATIGWLSAFGWISVRVVKWLLA